MVKKRKDSDNLPDDKYELAAYIIRRHWWKAILIIFSIGIMVTGFKCKWGDKEIEKDAIYKRTQAVSE
jgi:hypothetical protein